MRKEYLLYVCLVLGAFSEDCVLICDGVPRLSGMGVLLTIVVNRPLAVKALFAA